MDAFARAQALLNRDERLEDDLPPMEALSCCDSYGGTRSSPARSAASSKRSPGHHAAASNRPLPSLSELSQKPVLDMQKPAHPRLPRRRQVSPEQKRRETLLALEAALPSLDDEDARLVARARCSRLTSRPTVGRTARCRCRRRRPPAAHARHGAARGRREGQRTAAAAPAAAPRTARPSTGGHRAAARRRCCTRSPACRRTAPPRWASWTAAASAAPPPLGGARWRTRPWRPPRQCCPRSRWRSGASSR